MSFRLEFRGKTTGSWPLPTSCLEQVERLNKTPARELVEVIFGDEKIQDGTIRSVPRPALWLAVERLIPLASKLPGGFQVRVRPFIPGLTEDMVGRSVGVVIDGENYVISCEEDYWYVQSAKDVQEGTEAVRRYEPGEVRDEKVGTVKVEVKQSKRSELARLLRQLREYLKDDDSDMISIIWG